MARIKSNAAEIAFNTIKERINRFDLEPGATVSDFALSEELKMSRTPIREAIQQLEKFGLIKKERTKYTVTKITQKDISEILIARSAIERCAAEIIISNGGFTKSQQETINQLKEQNANELHNDNFFASFSTDSVFHRTLVSFSGNSRLEEIMTLLNLQGERLRWLSILTPSRSDGTITEHNLIIDAINAKDTDKAQMYISMHLQNSYKNYTELIKDNSWQEKILQMKHVLQKA